MKRTIYEPPTSIDWLRTIHTTGNTYKCQYCLEARKKKLHKRGAGLRIHQMIKEQP